MKLEINSNFMKILLLLMLATVTMFSIEPKAFAESTPMHKINQLVETLLAKYPYPPNDAIQASIIFRSDEFISLEKLSKTHWSLALDHLDSIPGGDAGKSILISVFQVLDAENYMTVLERLADKFRKRQISVSVMKAALYPRGRMQAFLVDNYQNTRIQAFLKGLKPYLEGETWIDDVLSGEEKAGWDDYREMYDEENIPIVLLQPLDKEGKTITLISPLPSLPNLNQKAKLSATMPGLLSTATERVPWLMWIAAAIVIVGILVVTIHRRKG